MFLLEEKNTTAEFLFNWSIQIWLHNFSQQFCIAASTILEWGVIITLMGKKLY